jgi:hypothetical protein
LFHREPPTGRLFSFSLHLRATEFVVAPHPANDRTGGLVSVAERRFPPPWSVEELDACFVESALALFTKVAALKTVR